MVNQKKIKGIITWLLMSLLGATESGKQNKMYFDGGYETRAISLGFL